jgi:hypothetical protein
LNLSIDLKFYLGWINLDQHGQIFTLEALLSLVLVIVIIGISANAMDISSNKIHEYTFEQSYQRIVGDLVDVLIKTPGSPRNWEKIKSIDNVTPGLAEIDESTKEIVSDTLDMNKIIRLKDNPELLSRMVPEGFNYSLMIYPLKSNLPTISIINRTPSQYVSDIYVVNRTVLCDYTYMNLYSSIRIRNYVDNTGELAYNCPHSFLRFNKHELPDFKNNKAGWICSPFQVGLKDISTTDFYLMTDLPAIQDKDALWLIDRPDNTSGSFEKFGGAPIKVSSRINDLFNGNNGVMILHVHSSGDSTKLFNVYLVGVPIGTPLNDVKLDYINPQPVNLVFKFWT